MDGNKLRRNKATTFLPETVFELNQTFVVPMKHIPIDGLKTLQNQKSHNHFSDISIPKCVNMGPSNSADDKEIIYKTVASVPIDEPDLIYTHLLQLSQCYEAMATNQKIVAFTDTMHVRKAFYGLIYNSTRTGLVVDAVSSNLVGVLSVTDFIMVLMKLWKFRTRVQDKNMNPRLMPDVISSMPISKWKEHQKLEGTHREFITTDIQESMFHAVSVLSKKRIHRLPIMDNETKDCMFILTHRRVLHFLWNYCLALPKPIYMHMPVNRLRLGCWHDIKYVTPYTSLIDCLDILINDKISGLPVVEEESMLVVDVYTRFDAIAVAFNKNFERLDMPVADAIRERTSLFGVRGRDSVVTVAECASMWQVLEVFIEKNVHRVFAVDELNKLKGVISLSDMISYMILRPARQLQTTDALI